MNIVVLGGGLSSERNVSIVTSVSVCRALRSLGHNAIYIDLFYGVDCDDNLNELFLQPDGFCEDVSIDKTVPDVETLKETNKNRIGNNVIEICKLADCVFLGLHGEDGEDGKIQSFFDFYNIKYTGSGMLGSAIGMNKYYTKQIMRINNIPTPEETDDLPCVIKLVNGGSSIGTWICDSFEDKQNAIEQSKNHDYIVEKKIEGREFTVPVLDNKALDVIEIIAPNKKFDYISKYQSGIEGATEVCPANISNELKEELQFYALKLHQALNLKVYSRSDFIVNNNNHIWCLEINTLPGMTPASLFPKAAKQIGLDYPHLCEKIIELSLNKYM